MGVCDHLGSAHNHAADRHLARRGGGFRLGEG
jgi:hypothetical protein